MRITFGIIMFILWTLVMIFLIFLERLQGKHDLENYLEDGWRG